jgi:hypothetical protein
MKSTLLAVELRNWTRRDFNAEVAVFDVVGDVSVAAVGKLVALQENGRHLDGYGQLSARRSAGAPRLGDHNLFRVRISAGSLILAGLSLFSMHIEIVDPQNIALRPK